MKFLPYFFIFLFAAYTIHAQGFIEVEGQSWADERLTLEQKISGDNVQLYKSKKRLPNKKPSCKTVTQWACSGTKYFYFGSRACTGSPASNRTQAEKNF